VDKLMIAAFVVGALLIVAILVMWLAPGGVQKDFFECPPANTLVVCPVGDSPDPATHGDCRAVGSGTTTLADGTCG
jgi:hypothetical protein